MHPGKKLLRAGDKFTFRAVVADAEGCPTGTRPTWSIVQGPVSEKASVDATGTVAVAADAPEGNLEVSASVGDKGVTVSIEVASPEHYDALLGRLGDAGEGAEPAVAVIAVGALGGRQAVAADSAKERKTLFLAIVGAVAATLAFAGLVLVRRGTRPADPIEADEAPPSSTAAGLDGEPGRGSPNPSEGPLSGPAPAPAPPPAAVPARKGRGKICPTCGERYPTEATMLVLLN